MGIGALLLFVALGLVMKNPGWGFVFLLAGAIAIGYGMRRHKKSCPNCRTHISPRAATCPQCHAMTGWAPAVAA
ncbi:MAG: hypothetical protein ACT4PT_12850 [Methanobacteriota archaeon]